MSATEKVSITIDRGLLEEARRHADGNLSGWISDAVRQRLRLEEGREFLDRLDREEGPIPEEIREDVHRRWRGSRSTAAS